MAKRELKLSRMEKTILHLDKFNRFRDVIDVPPALTQEGIAKATEIAQQKVSVTVRKLKEKGLVYEKVLHIQGRKKSKKAYFLTDAGIREAKTLRKGLQMSQYIDFADQTLQPRYFFGRVEELGTFRDWLERDSYKVLVVSGIAGIGKTAYVAKAVEPYRERMHIFWYRFNEWSTLRSVLNRLGDFLSETGKVSLSANLRTKEKIDIDEVLIILANDLAYLNTLLILDDYQKIKDKEEIVHLFGALRQLLEQIEGIKIIVVGREVPRFFYDERDVSIKKIVKEINLKGLDRESSLKLLEMKHISGNKGERLYELTKGHPFALEVIHKTEKFETQNEVKRFVIDEIFSSLTPQEEKILEIASVFRFPVYSTTYLDIAENVSTKDTSEALPPSLLGISSKKTDKQSDRIEHEVIDGLVNKSLLQASGDVCDVHDLIRDFLYSRLPEHTKKEYHEKIAQYYLNREIENKQAKAEACYHLLTIRDYQQVAALIAERGGQMINEGYWQETIEITDKIPLDNISSDLKPRILEIKALISKIKGEPDEAIKHYENSIKHWEETNDYANLAKSHLAIGEIYTIKNQWEKALENIKKTFNYSNKAQDMTVTGKAFQGKGFMMHLKGEFKEAQKAYEKSLEYLYIVEDEKKIALVQENLGVLMTDLGRYEEAIEYLRKSLSIYGINDKREIGRLYINLGSIDSELENYNEALEWFEKALTLAEELSDIRYIAYVEINIVDTMCTVNPQFTDDKYEMAIEYCKNALSIFEKIKEKRMVCSTLMEFGIVHTRHKEWEESEHYFTKALEISEPSKFNLENGKTYYHYGCMLADAGRKKDAKDRFKSSIDIWKKMNNEKWIEKVEKELEKVHKP